MWSLGAGAAAFDCGEVTLFVEFVQGKLCFVQFRLRPNNERRGSQTRSDLYAKAFARFPWIYCTLVRSRALLFRPLPLLPQRITLTGLNSELATASAAAEGASIRRTRAVADDRRAKSWTRNDSTISAFVQFPFRAAYSQTLNAIIVIKCWNACVCICVEVCVLQGKSYDNFFSFPLVRLILRFC